MSRVYTDYAVFDLRPDGIHVLETFGCMIEDLRARIDVDLLPG